MFMSSVWYAILEADDQTETVQKNYVIMFYRKWENLEILRGCFFL